MYVVTDAIETSSNQQQQNQQLPTSIEPSASSQPSDGMTNH